MERKHGNNDIRNIQDELKARLRVQAALHGRSMEDEARDISDMAGQVQGFDNDAAGAYREIAVSRKAAGKPISQFDALIAAVAKSRGASLATRNIKDFVDCGIQVIDPWHP